MKLFYTEEILRNLVTTKVLPELPEENRNVSFSCHVTSVLIKNNTGKCSSSCILCKSSVGILVVLMHNFNVETIHGFNYIKFSQIQGIKLKKGLILYTISFQLLDGTYLKFQLSRKNSKYLPHQANHLEQIISLLEAKNLNIMDNTIHKKAVKKERLSNVIYLGTLTPFVIVLLSQLGQVESQFVVWVLILGTVILHGVLYFLFDFYIVNGKKHSFTTEFQKYMDTYKQDKDALSFYNKLKKLCILPPDEHLKFAYYLALSSTAIELGLYNEALEYLGFIDSSDNINHQIAVEKQKQFIAEKRTGS